MRVSEWVQLFNKGADDIIWHKVVRLIESQGYAWHTGMEVAERLTGTK